MVEYLIKRDQDLTTETPMSKPGTKGPSQRVDAIRTMVIAVAILAGLMYGGHLIQNSSDPGPTIEPQPAARVPPAPAAAPPESVATPTAPAPSVGYDRLRDREKAAKAAEAFEGLMFSTTPSAKSVLSFVDISMRDGHLLVYFKALFSEQDPALKQSIQASIETVWRDTKYVREMGWPARVEFIEDKGGAR